MAGLKSKITGYYYLWFKYDFMKNFALLLTFLIAGISQVTVQAQRLHQPTDLQTQVNLHQRSQSNGNARSVQTQLLTERWDTYNDTTNVWNYTDSLQYGYNNNGINDTLTYLAYVNGSWINYYAIIYTYNHANVYTEALEVIWDVNASNWKNFEDITQTLDGNNNILYKTYRYWPSANATNWINGDQQVGVYDVDNNKLDSTYMIWDTTSGTWNNVSNDLWAFDSVHSQTSYIHQTWNGVAWLNQTQSIDTNDTHGNHLVDVEQNWISNSWVNNSITVTSFNSFNKPVQDIEQFWSSGAWTSPSKDTFTYDGADNLIQWQRCEWLTDSAKWFPIQQAFYAYVDGNKLSVYSFQNWGDSSWVNHDSTIYAYDNNFNKTEYKDFYWNGNTNLWDANNDDKFEYNLNNEKIYEVHQEYDLASHAYINNYQYFYYYGQIDPMALNEAKNELDAALYPNPSPGKELFLRVNLPSDAQIRVSLYDADGKLIATQTQTYTAGSQNVQLNYPQLSTGNYYIQVIEYNTSKSSALILVKQ